MVDALSHLWRSLSLSLSHAVFVFCNLNVCCYYFILLFYFWPGQVGMMLRGMGFGNKTLLYVASGKIYNEKKYMAPLRQLFPLLETKETLASADELAPFKVTLITVTLPLCVLHCFSLLTLFTVLFSRGILLGWQH